ncbi:MAG TPA: flagellar basal body L-ring protein FlgH [Terriglobales bacterium]|jgi:flagellar L-ring protein precursor FlgH|nr:flagellar basal body L-ring protein FlgH [Terriglobales bacterium]
MTRTRNQIVILLAVSCIFALPNAQAKSQRPTKELRADYLARVRQEMPSTSTEPSLGSLWVNGGGLTDLASDYKAHQTGDTIVIQVFQQTTAESNGDVNTDRSYQGNSAITGLPAKIKTGGVDPLIGLQSSAALKGQGSANSSSKLLTTLTGVVIGVLPGGNLVVEAQRHVLMNNQNETMIVRGVVRPGDVSSLNTVSSTVLANLEIELKGKGVISDATRRPNALIRILQWLTIF